MSTTDRIRTLYFTAVPIALDGSGGALCCRNHVQRLAGDARLAITVSATGPPEQEAAVRSFVESTGAPCHFVAFRGEPARPPASIRSNRLIARRWPILREADSIAQPHVGGAVLDLVRRERIQIVIVDYVPSALFVRDVYRAPVRRITVTLNHEAAFFREMRDQKRVPPNASGTWLANMRVAHFERSVHSRSHGVVALTEGDLPTGRFAGLRRVIPPAFDARLQRWRYTASRRLFFVGNIAHHPNRMAVEWIATRFAPALAAHHLNAEIRVIGASTDMVPADWRAENVTYLGLADHAAVEREFLSADLFLAPIANRFGAKIKLLDALAFATPFIATDQAMTGLPFLSDVPRINLHSPQMAATLASVLIENPDKLEDLSRRLSDDLSRYLGLQATSWGILAHDVLARPI